MKTIMIIDKNNHFVNLVRESVINEDITVLTAENNRQAIEQSGEMESIDLYLIPSKQTTNPKKFITCKSTDSLYSPIPSMDQVNPETATSEEILSFLKKKLNE